MEVVDAPTAVARSGAPGSRRLVQSKVQRCEALGEEDGPFGGAPCTCSAAITNPMKAVKAVAVVGSQWQQLQERRESSHEPHRRNNCIAKIRSRGERERVWMARARGALRSSV